MTKNVLFMGSAAGNYLVCLPVFRMFKRRFPKIATSKELSERVLNSWLYPYAQRLFLKYSEL